MKIKRIEVDLIIVGGGPGGCEIARHFSKKGKKVIIIEKGAYSSRFLGSLVGAMSRMEIRPSLSSMPVLKTKEGSAIPLCSGIGGGTLLYCGSAFLPDRDFWSRHGIHLSDKIINEAARETRVSKPPEEFIGPGTRRLQNAANDIGQSWEILDRHIDFDRCIPGCDKCTYGCSRGAKWTGMVYAEEAVDHGAIILDRTEVTGFIIMGIVCTGVKAKGRNGIKYEIHAPVVVCSAGGIGTSILLKNAGIDSAGTTFAGDPTGFTIGFLKNEKGNHKEHNMVMGYRDNNNGVVFSTMVAPYLAWLFQLMGKSAKTFIKNAGRYHRAMGLFVKVTDEASGKIKDKNNISKTYTQRDSERIRYGTDMNQKILIKAGCIPGSIFHTDLTLGHPGQTVPLGILLDNNFESPIKNIFCCDTSVMPEAPGMPPALTVVVLAKHLCSILDIRL